MARPSREENVDPPERLRAILDTLDALAAAYDMRIVVSTHPRTRQRLAEMREAHPDPRIEFLKPFGFLEYVKLEMNAACVLSDSGTLTEEAALLGFPAVMLRETHERPEGMDEAAVLMAGLSARRVLQAVALVRAHAGPVHAARASPTTRCPRSRARLRASSSATSTT